MAEADTGKISRRLRRAVEGGGLVRAFIVCRTQPHREVLERTEGSTGWRLDSLRTRYTDAVMRAFGPSGAAGQAETEWHEAELAARKSAFNEIAAVISAEQAEVERSLIGAGARNLRRYTAINMFAADLPAAAVDAVALHPLVAELHLVATRTAQLATSAPSLGVSRLWDAGFTGGGESVAVLDTGIRAVHPAFSGLEVTGKTFLTGGKEDKCFADDDTTAEDRQGHGTHVAGIVAARGAPHWSAHQGVAKGLSRLYALKVAYRTCEGDGRASDEDVVAALQWAAEYAPWIKVLNYSFGGAADDDDDFTARLFDYFADTYGWTVSVAAGNETESRILGLWIDSGPLTSPGTAWNILTVAAMNTQGTVDRQDDTVAIFSSRGPTPGGRKKPDLAAPGGLRDRWGFLADGWSPEPGIFSADFNSDEFVAKSGTSMAAPHIAGAAALLRSAGVRDPLAIKALLLNTTDWLNWGKDQGWGYANLERAFQQRRNLITGRLSGDRAALYKGSAHGQFYSTLTWNRAVRLNEGTLQANCLSDLDLTIYKAASGDELASSESSQDNVEKAFASTEGQVVVNVTHWGKSSCRSPEPFAVAFSEAGFQPAAGPLLSMTCTGPASVPAGSRLAVSCTIANRGDLPALSVKGTFAGSGNNATQDFGTIPAGGSSSRTWVFTAPPSLGSFPYSVNAETTSFGTLFTASASFVFSTTSGVRVTDSMVARTVDPASCARPAPAVSLLTTEKMAVMWFNVTGAQAGDVASIKWYTPAGPVHLASDWKPVASAGSWCFSSSMEIAGQAPASSPGNWSATVAWNGTTLVTRNFTIVTPDSDPKPRVTSLNPSSAVAGGGAVTLSVLGNNFLHNSVVTVNGQARSLTGPPDARQLSVQLSASDLAAPGTYPVLVTNPVAGGAPAASNRFDFVVIDPRSTQAGVLSLATTQRVYAAGDWFALKYSVLAGSAPVTLDLMMAFVPQSTGNVYYYYDDPSDSNQWLHSMPRPFWTGIPRAGDAQSASFEVTDNVPSGDYHVRAYFSRPDSNQPLGAVAETDFAVTTNRSAGDCFVATAAFGSPGTGQVRILRDFLDAILLSVRQGRAFVDWYYRWSPGAAGWLRDHSAARKLTRAALWLPVGFAWISLRAGVVTGIFVLLGLVLLLGWSFRRGPRWWKASCLVLVAVGLLLA